MMRVLKLTTYSTLALLLILPFLVHARPAGDQVLTEQDIFARTLYPFMRSNCIECHGEQAVYPAGPTHSHSNINSAFKTFSKFINKNDFANSRFIKYANNKHFCKEFGVSCKNMDQIVLDLNKLFVDYSTQVKVHHGTGAMSKGTILTGEFQTIAQELTVGNAKLNLVVTLKRFSDEYLKIASIRLSSDTAKYISLDGIDIRINGQLPQKATGLESLRRNLSFDDKLLMRTELLTGREVILTAKKNDRFSIELKDLKSTNIPRHEVCTDRDKRQAAVDLLKTNTRVYETFLLNTFGQLYTADKLSQDLICDQLMLQLNLKQPSQSILLLQTSKEDRTGALAGVREILRITRKEEASTKPNPLKIIDLESEFIGTCFQLEDGSGTCFGENLSARSSDNVFSIPAGSKKIFAGTIGFTYVNAAGQLVLAADRDERAFPNNLDGNEYTPPAPIVDVEMGYYLTCFLTVNGDVYCGGDTMTYLGFNNSTSEFFKVNRVPIKSIHGNLARIFMLDEKGNVHVFGFEYFAEAYKFPGIFTYTKNEIDIGLLPPKEVLTSQMLSLDYKVKDVYQNFRDTCFKDTSDELHCYATRKEPFGDIERIPGAPPESNISFTQIYPNARGGGSCGLTAENDLYCIREYPEGLMNESGSDSSQTYKKIINTPKNFRKIAFSSNTICFLTEDGFVQCAGSSPLLVGEIENQNNQITDRSGRAFYTGSKVKSNSKTVSPYILESIKRN